MFRKFGYIVLVLMIVLAGCSKAGDKAVDNGPKYQEDPSVNIAKDEVLLYVMTDMANGLGDLYIQKGGADKEKIASNVLKDQFGYMYNAKVAMYIDKEHTLYQKEAGKPSEQIATDVYGDSIVHSEDETTILFLKSTVAKDYTGSTGDLYRMVRGSEKEKISSDVSNYNYEVSKDGKVVTFVTADGSLYRKAADVTDKEKIGSDVSVYRTSPDGSVTIYQNAENDVYIKYANAVDKEKLASSNIGQVVYTQDSKTLAYLDDYRSDSSKGELILMKNGYEKAKLASDVQQFEFTALGDYIYFLNEDKTLYAKELTDAEDAGDKKKKEADSSEAPAALKILNPAEKVKIADDIKSFNVAPDGTSVIFLDSDHNLFIQRSGEEKAKVASDVSEAHLYNQTILMLSKEKTLASVDLTLDEAALAAKDKAEKELKDKEKEAGATAAAPALLPASPVKEKVKIADKVEEYSADPSLKYIAFKTTDNEFFLKTKNQPEAVKVIEKTDAYSSIHFLNVMLFEKLVTIDQLVGSWHASVDAEGESYDWYVEITKDLKYIIYDSGPDDVTRPFELLNATPNTVEMSFTKDSDDMATMEVVDKNNLKGHYYSEDAEDSITDLKRVTKEELTKAVAAKKEQYKKEQEKQAIIDAANSTADSLLYEYLYNSNDGVKVYNDHSTESEQMGTLGSYTELYVSDTFVSESGEVWCKSNVYFSDVSMYLDVWFKHKDIQ
ncbi:hypothetical protein PCCS19_07410 [Paenibacillus sp. CCS19]|uniref:hypothetical protein n=1 Tax=Paenibacillus sp. CCS19 TaxID=3158387 RepID=UPI00255D3C31|nr:hypothetical protein [Paenibacillus cellulosilyticus]GMK37687.1 hypothetical protein PCCS19_07410 [Paenibacillus cellulosilyticus]